MAAGLTAAVAVLALLVFVLLGIVIELLGDVKQLRAALGILDRPLDVDLGPVAGMRPSAFGLPGALDTAGSAIVLFLSDGCSTCHTLAEGFGGDLPAGLWVVLEAKSPDSARAFLTAKGLTGPGTDGRLLLDPAEDIATRIGLRTTPVGFRVEDGRLVSATTVPSRRYLSTMLGNRIRLEPTATTRSAGRKAS